MTTDLTPLGMFGLIPSVPSADPKQLIFEIPDSMTVSLSRGDLIAMQKSFQCACERFGLTQVVFYDPIHRVTRITVYLP